MPVPKMIMIKMNYTIAVILFAIICTGQEVAKRPQTTDKDECKVFAVNKFLQILDETRDCNSDCGRGRPTDCTELKSHGYKTGVYMIHPARSEGFNVYCDMDTMDKGWTVFQRRFNGKVDFFRRWTDYKNGFGNVNGEHWLGNKYIHKLKSRENISYESLLGILKRISVTQNTADLISKVKELGTNSMYLVTMEMQEESCFGGGAFGDSLNYHNGHMFTTKDKDNDNGDTRHCSHVYKGAWWYGNCHHANLNGLYLNGQNNKFGEGVNWYTWRGHYFSLKTTIMMIRRKED